MYELPVYSYKKIVVCTCFTFGYQKINFMRFTSSHANKLKKAFVFLLYPMIKSIVKLIPALDKIADIIYSDYRGAFYVILIFLYKN